jgi:acetamidase/formamidase
MPVEQCVHKVSDIYPTALKVRPGEPFTLKLQNAFGRSFQTVEEFEEFLKDKELKKSLNHPCTGPIEIETDRENISLAIHIIDLKATRGYQCISKSTGLLKDRFEERCCEIIEVPNDQEIHFGNNDLILKSSPKIGCIATIDGESRSPGRMCENGGNIDLNFLRKGCTIYLPVNHPQAKILVGDLHICQGNGEMAGIAVEADGEVTLKVDIVDKINFPIIDHPNQIIIIGWGPDVHASMKKCVENSMDYFSRVFPFCDWPETEIYKLISAEGNLSMGNATGNVATCGLAFLKNRILNKHRLSVFA